MPGHDIIVIAASAGGVEALKELVRDLPADLPAAVFIVLHIPPQSPSALPQILSRYGPLKATHPQDGQMIEPGQIYIAPPDHHLLVERGHVRVVRGPKENRHRPAADPLFRSAACSYGPRVMGVVLTGALDDGTAGLISVKRRGGVAETGADLEDEIRPHRREHDDREVRGPSRQRVAEHLGHAQLGNAGLTAQKLETTATVSLEKVGEGFSITKSHLDLVARVPGADKAKFDAAVKAAETGCPVSKLFKAEISVNARLES